MIAWIDAIPPQWLGPPLAYIRGKLKGALIVAKESAHLAPIMQEIANYLDTLFDHYVCPDYPGDAALLQPASIASQHIHIKPLPITVHPYQFCYRLQGYLELSQTNEITDQQWRYITDWLMNLRPADPYLQRLSILANGLDATQRKRILQEHLHHYFIRVIDPGYEGEPAELQAIHEGRRTPLTYTQ